MYQHTDPVAIWAEGQIAALDSRDIPLYGTRAWRQLAADDPRRAAAILAAAEQWRRERVEAYWLDQLADEDPVAWWQEVTEDADAEAVKLSRALRQLRTIHETRNARAYREPVPVKATAGWPPVRIPGKPDQYRHLIQGRQTDVNSTARETAA